VQFVQFGDAEDEAITRVVMERWKLGGGGAEV
jgi:hypothetical protein